MSYEEKHPILLPNEHRISLLITSSMHMYGHTGVATTTAKTSRKYWILKANKLTGLVCEVQVCILSKNSTQGRDATDGRSPFTSPITAYTVLQHCSRLLWSLQCQDRAKQEHRTTRSYINLFKHQSCSPRAGGGQLHNGFYAGTAQILLYQRLPSGDDER